jgi:hypothetical protein
MNAHDERPLAPGDHEDALPPVGSANVLGRHAESGRTISKFVQAPPHRTQPPTLARRDVFGDCDEWTEFANAASEFPPETGSFAVETGSGGVGSAVVLARESASEKVDGW